jgi:chemotaxis protein MotB
LSNSVNHNNAKTNLLLPPGGPNASHAEEHSDGNWLVSYADMMTLLVGFFVLLLSFSTINEEKLEEVKKSITVEFGGTYEVPFGEIVDRIKNELNKIGLGDQFVIKQTDLGIDISFLGTVFFDTGSAVIKPAADLLLQKLGPIILSESGQFDIVIEGHTDDVPIGAGLPFKNNWELSSIRACRVLDTFTALGFASKRLTAVGYGETRPIAQNRDSSGNSLPQNQSQNRRVVIKLIRRTTPMLVVSPSPDQSVGH